MHDFLDDLISPVLHLFYYIFFFKCQIRFRALYISCFLLKTTPVPHSFARTRIYPNILRICRISLLLIPFSRLRANEFCFPSNAFSRSLMSIS